MTAWLLLYCMINFKIKRSDHLTNLVKCDQVLTTVMLYYTKAWKKYSIIMLPRFWTIVLTWQVNILRTLLNYGITIIHAHKSMLLPWHMSKNMPIPCSFLHRLYTAMQESTPLWLHVCTIYTYCTTVWLTLTTESREEERERERERECVREKETGRSGVIY